MDKLHPFFQANMGILNNPRKKNRLLIFQVNCGHLMKCVSTHVWQPGASRPTPFARYLRSFLESVLKSRKNTHAPFMLDKARKNYAWYILPNKKKLHGTSPIIFFRTFSSPTKCVQYSHFIKMDVHGRVWRRRRREQKKNYWHIYFFLQKK